MKKNILILLISYFLGSCQSENIQLKNSSWQLCTGDSLYAEMHFYEEYFLYCPLYYPYGNEYIYHIKKDSLFTSRGGIERKAKINVLNKDSLELIFEEGIQVMKRLPQRIIVPKDESDSDFIVNYNKRRLNTSCTKELFDNLPETDFDLDLKNLDPIIVE